MFWAMYYSEYLTLGSGLNRVVREVGLSLSGLLKFSELYSSLLYPKLVLPLSRLPKNLPCFAMVWARVVPDIASFSSGPGL